MELAIIFHHLFFPIPDPSNLFFLRQSRIKELLCLIGHYVGIEKPHPEEIPGMIMKVWKIQNAIVTAGSCEIFLAITEDHPTCEPCEPCEERHQKRFPRPIVGDMFEDPNQ